MKKPVRKRRKAEPPSTAERNMETMLKLEEEFLEQRSMSERIADRVGRVVGAISFIIFQLISISLWIAINMGAAPQTIPIFDPYPFSLLGTIISFEGVLLAAFVLIKQNRMSFRTDHRSHLDLQINMLAEQETTKTIQMLMRINNHLGIRDDSEAKALASDTPLEEIARDLDRRLKTSDMPN